MKMWLLCLKLSFHLNFSNCRLPGSLHYELVCNFLERTEKCYQQSKRTNSFLQDLLKLNIPGLFYPDKTDTGLLESLNERVVALIQRHIKTAEQSTLQLVLPDILVCSFICYKVYNYKWNRGGTKYHCFTLLQKLSCVHDLLVIYVIQESCIPDQVEYFQQQLLEVIIKVSSDSMVVVIILLLVCCM